MEVNRDSLYKPCIELTAAAPAVQSQSFDHITIRSRLDNASDQCVSIQGTDDSLHVGVPVPVAVGSPAPATGSGDKRKRGRPGKSQMVTAPKLKPRPPPKNKVEDEDVCFICFDGGSLVLCDRKGCPKAYHPACIKRDEAFFQSTAKWYCGWHICSVCLKAGHYMCYTCTYSLCKGCAKDADYSCVRGNMGFCTTCMKTIMLIENKDQANTVQVDFDDQGSWEYLFKVYWILLKEKLSLTVDELTKAKNPCKGMMSMACKQQLPETQNLVHHGNSFLSNTPHEHSKLKKPMEQVISTEKASNENGASFDGTMEWASKKLLEFVAHMKNGDTSVLSQFDVQMLLLEYVKRNNLRDPRSENQIICDLRLKSLFGKPRVGHIEMLKLLEFHFLIKEDSKKNAFIRSGIVGTATSLMGRDDNENALLTNKNKRQKTQNKVEEGEPKNNVDEYAAIDIHNINMIYLRGNLMENLIEDEKLDNKVVGSIVRIRISSSDDKQDLYRLVPVVGVSKVAVPYKMGEKTVDIMLEVLNLNKKEDIAIDTISNQDFSEEECRHLRQSMRCGLVKQLTVGEIQKKAIELQMLRLNDQLEGEILKLNLLLDRARETSHKKKLRECIEKLQLLKTPEELQRRLCQIPEVHADPKMNPNYETEEDTGGFNNKTQENYSGPEHLGFSRCENQPITLKRKVKEEGPINDHHRITETRDANGFNDQAAARSGPEIPTATLATGSPFSPSDNEADQLWHYRDPSGNIQGPFSMIQLRKWSTTGYFPPDMRIWTMDEQDDSILLTDAMNSSFHKAAHLLYNFSVQCQQLGAATSNQICSSDVGWSENMNSPGDNQIVEELQSSKARLESNNNNEFERTDGLGSISSGSTASVVSEKDMQPGTSQHSELKDNTSCSDRSQVCHPTPSSGVGPRDDALPHEGQGQGGEGSMPSPHHENHVSLGSGAADQISDAQYENENQSNCKSYLRQSSGEGGEGQGQGGEGSVPSPHHENHVSLGSGAADQISDAQYENENHLNCKSYLRQSSGQNWRPFPINLNLNDMDTNCGLSPATKSDSFEHDGDVNPPELPGPTPKDSNQESKGLAAEKLQAVSSDVPAQMSDVRDLPRPTPKPMNEDQGRHIAESNPPPPAKVVVQDSGPSWSTASSLVVGGSQLPEIADEWGRYSRKPSTDEWSSGLVSVLSLKQPEVVSGHATPTSNIDPLACSSQSHPTSNASNWHGVLETIEFSTLAEESVSDLLAEVDAMEFQCGLGSPTSAMRYRDETMKNCKSECFSIGDLSPSPDPGKSDALSSTGDIQLSCDEPVGPYQADAYDTLKLSSGHSSRSSEGEMKAAHIPPPNQGEAGSAVHPRPSCPMGLDVTDTSVPRENGLTAMDTVWGRVPEHVNLNWGAPAERISNIGWCNGQGAPGGNLNFDQGALNGGIIWDGQQKYNRERYTGPIDWVQGGDMGYNKGRPFWNRQPYDSDGDYSRPPSKGQRVCKFYESGHCKKGASCDYLHL